MNLNRSSLRRTLMACVFTGSLMLLLITGVATGHTADADIYSPQNSSSAEVATTTPTAEMSPTIGGLFVAVPIAQTQQSQLPPTVIRSRYVQIRFDQLGMDRLAAASPELTKPTQTQVTLNFFDDAIYPASLDQVLLNPTGSYSWIGHLEDVALSQVILTVRDDQLFGSAIFPGGVFAIEPGPSGLHIISEIDQSRFPGDEVSWVADSQPAEQSAMQTPQTDDGSLIDVLVAYTDDARAGAGSRTAIEELINNAINATNSSYSNSGVVQRVRLVGTVEVAYAETLNSVTDVTNLRNGTAGLQIVHDLRNAYAADAVTLIVEELDFAGRAFEIMGTVATTFENNAFDVTKRDQAVSNLSFAHELGHLMGARHDWFMDDATGQPYTFNHGYVVTPTISSPWRTVMAYNDECAANGVSCTRISYWSNPNVLRGKLRMGVPAGTSTSCTAGKKTNPECDADDHLALNSTRATFANFRPGNLVDPRVDGIAGNDGTGDGTSGKPFRTVTAGAYRVRANGTVWIRPGNYLETPMINVPNPPNANMRRVLVIDRPMTLRCSNCQPGQSVTIGQ